MMMSGRSVLCASAVLAVAAHHAVEFIGWPEGELPLAEATVYCDSDAAALLKE